MNSRRSIHLDKAVMSAPPVYIDEHAHGGADVRLALATCGLSSVIFAARNGAASDVVGSCLRSPQRLPS
jgi:hypothetical protein